MNILRKYFIEILAAGLLLFLLLSTWWTPFAEAANKAQEDVLRLHILANSDGEEDQRLKLLVRDRLLKESESWFTETEDKSSAEAVLQNRLAEISNIAADELQKQGNTQQVKVSLCRSDFSTRIYEDFTLPAGTYDTLRIELGTAEGRNWWCIIFPSLCIPAAAESDLPADLLLLKTEPKYEPRFALWELYQKVLG